MPCGSRTDIDAVIATGPGTITCYADEPDPMGRRITLDADADRRVIRHLATHPTHTDLFTGRPRRVALLSDASAVLDFEPLAAEAALPAVESQAVHLHRATGLDVIPMPIAARDAAELGRPISVAARLAAIQALVDLTPPGGLLPPVDHPRLTSAVADAAVRALAAD
ncbi:hypothetical protein [Candidatus Frankia alpina]|uniref:hypothetical protein n=1 Tax=Candidatus Frankia alpina TaxID=2699483 RepID=UPI001F1FFFC7|nr:hypothetical protein [Candidatus Frankia alpina]